MLAPQHPFPRHYQIYQNKLITIISPYTGEQFKIELSGEESEFRELLATLLNIDPSYIKGLKDSFGNYYTISCALKDPYIFANGNNLFSLVLNLQNNNYNKYKQLSNPYNKNLLYNINNNYHNRTEYNEIYIGNRKNKLLEDNPKSKKQIRKYSTLIKKLIPAINRNFKEEDDYNYEPNTSYFDEYSFSKRDKYQKILEKQKSNFNKEQLNILRELLKMENITIINYFKIYEKSKNKKDLIKNLNNLSKKYQKKLKKVSESEEESEESLSDNDERDKKTKKNKKYNKNKSSSESEESSSQHPPKHQKKGHHQKKNSSSSKDESSNDSESDKDNESNTTNKSNEESENNEEEEENEEESEEKKHNFPIKCSNLSELINAIKDELDDKIDLSCLFSNEIDFIKKTETQKMQLIKDEFDIKDFTLTENSFELIKKHYENILKKVIMKDLSKEEKELLLKLIKKKNKSIKLRFKALLRHNNYEFLITDIKECLNDRLKKNQKKSKKHKNKNKNDSDGDEHQINLEEKESMSINSNSNNDNEGEEEYMMGESTKSIRKNERMAKNNKKNKNGNGSQKSKSKDDESAGQIKLFQMEDSSEDDSESNKKNDNKKDNNEKEKENDNISKKNGGDGIKDEEFGNVINKLKNEGKLDITDKEVKILENEFKNKSEKLRSIWEIYQIELEEDDFIDSLKLILKLVNKNGDYVINEDNNNENKENNGNDNNENNNNDENSNNDGEKDKPYAKEIISGLKGAKFGKKGNKKIINILLKNKIFTKEEMRNIEEDLDQNNQFVVGTFELLYVIMNVEDFVENLNIRLHLPEGESGQNQNSALAIDDEKYNQIRNNLENIVKSFSEEDQNKIRELFEKKDINLLNILESEVNDIEKAKKSILNFLGKN